LVSKGTGVSWRLPRRGWAVSARSNRERNSGEGGKKRVDAKESWNPRGEVVKSVCARKKRLFRDWKKQEIWKKKTNRSEAIEGDCSEPTIASGF